MLQYLTVPVTPFQQNCSIVWCDATQEAALIDAGGDIPVLLAEIARLGLTLTALWVTHAHIDHAGAVGELTDTLALPIVGPHPGDQFWIDGLAQQSISFGFAPARSARCVERCRHGGHGVYQATPFACLIKK